MISHGNKRLKEKRFQVCQVSKRQELSYWTNCHTKVTKIWVCDEYFSDKTCCHKIFYPCQYKSQDKTGKSKESLDWWSTCSANVFYGNHTLHNSYITIASSGICFSQWIAPLESCSILVFFWSLGYCLGAINHG